MPFLYFTPEQASACVPEGTKRLCVAASFRKEAGLCPNFVKYLGNLAPQFDVMVLLTNPREGLGGDVGLPGCCAVVTVPNMLLDFGMWSRLLHVLDGVGLERLCLVNDSCLVVNDITPCFVKAARKKWEFWGMVSSFEVSPHVQSFFLVSDGERAVRCMLDFFRSKDMASFLGIDKSTLVKEFEVGLSTHMATCGFELYAVFPWQITMFARSVIQPDFKKMVGNVSYWHPDVLLVMGCPIIKKTRVQLAQLDKLIKQFADPDMWETTTQ